MSDNTLRNVGVGTSVTMAQTRIYKKDTSARIDTNDKFVKDKGNQGDIQDITKRMKALQAEMKSLESDVNKLKENEEKPQGSNPQKEDPEPPCSTGMDVAIPAYGTAVGSSVLGFMSNMANTEAGSMAINFKNVMGTTGFGTVNQTGNFLSAFSSSPVAQVIPYVSGMAAGLNLLKGSNNLIQGMENKNKSQIMDGVMDMGLAATTTLSMLPPTAMMGIAGTGVILGVKLVKYLAKKAHE